MNDPKNKNDKPGTSKSTDKKFVFDDICTEGISESRRKTSVLNSMPPPPNPHRDKKEDNKGGK